MKTASPPPGEPSEPTPQEISRGLAELETLVAEHAPPAVANDYPVVSGETRRVHNLRAEVAEAHLLADLQDDETPLMLDSAKVRKLRRRTWEAARLHELAQHPAALAYRDAKIRRVTTTMTMAAASIALAVSSIGVQASVAKALALKDGSAGWWAAFGVEAVLSLTLLAAVGVQAYSAIRGKVVDRKSLEGKKLFRVEMALLALTLTLNCWPAFVTPFDPLVLIVHSLGPVAAVLAVWVLPTFWKIIADLPVPWRSTPFGKGGTGRKYRGNASGDHPSEYPSSTPYGMTPEELDIEAKAAHIRHLIATGELPDDVGVKRIREALRCGTDKAQQVRDRLAGGGGWNNDIDEEYR